MLSKIYYLLLLTTSVAFSQTITVDDTSYTATNLAELLLDGSCIDPTNVSYSDAQSAAYFNQNGSVFPIAEGVIIRTGIANLTAGPYTDTNLSSQINSNGDTFLENISTSTGQTATITDTAFLQFDFTPIASDFSFNFVFASNEYGEYQCGFSDVFAFELTDLTTNITTNLAVLPSTTIPVTVATIRDNAYNTGCTSENPALFSTYNVTNPGASTLNMRGHTVVLNASTTLTVNNPYRIRLVIGDYNNPDYDSAVFIESGSFTTPLDIGADATICSGNSINVTTNLDAVEYTHLWTLNGATLPSTANNIDVTQAGTYVVTATKGSCTLTDEIIISDLTFNTPNDLTNCDDGSGALSYDLSVNDEALLGIDPLIYNVVYFATQADIPNNPITAPNITNYVSAGNETIYIKLFNIQSNTFCDAELNFDLLLESNITATQPNDIQLCDVAGATAILIDQDVAILNGLSSADYTVSYYGNQNDALAGTGAISGTLAVTLATSPQTVWAAVQSNTNPDCSAVTSFDVIVNPLPPVSTLPNVIECTEFTLPNITQGNYYDAADGPNGTGTLLNIGDIIIDSGTYYIYNGPDANGCFNESSFVLTFIDEYSIAEDYCEQFVVPVPPAGNFYTAIDGPTGTGTLIPDGTIFTNSFTLYYYAEINGVVCRNEPFPITIHALPPVDTQVDITECTQAILPPRTNGNYFMDSAGVTPLPSTTITTSQTIFIVNTEAHNLGLPTEITCSDFTSFDVTIINTTSDITACGNYTLPALTTGNYFTAPAGGGTPIPVGTVINTVGNTDIYIFSPTSTAPNCTDNLKFTVTIIAIPPVDTVTPPTNLYCIDAPYVLPALTNGSYYNAPNGPNGTGNPLAAGSSITNVGNTTIYVYNQIQWGPNPVNYCFDETSFTIETRDLPPVDNYTDVYRCDPYTLQPLTNGTYYDAPDGPSGTGAIIPAGTVISTTQTIYIYNQYTDLTSCISETVITVFILGVDVGDRLDIAECDTYTLPYLNTSVVDMHYYSASGGNAADEILPANFIYNTPGTYTVYVFADNGDRFVCTDEDEFTITISATPVLPIFGNISECGTYTLPDLTNPNYNIGYYSAPNGVGLIDVANYIITTVGTQTIYVYATAFNNTTCNDEKSFTLEIKAIPPVDTLLNALNCVDDPFELPTLINGDYFTGPGRTGTQLVAGSFINTIGTTTIYINNLINGCENETSFTVEIRALPPVDTSLTINKCDSYTLPTLTNGTYYDAPDGINGTGTILAVGTVITTTQTIYIYNNYADLATCDSETSFDVNIVGIQVDTPGNITECDSYLLPALDTTTVNQAYYSASGGNIADLITNLTLITTGTQTVYIYAEINSPIFCSSEESFTVTLNNSPILPNLPDQDACITFTLPVLNTASYNAAYYTAPGGNTIDLIDVANYTITNEGVNTIYVYASNLTAPNCFTETSFTVTIYPLQELAIADGVICIDPITGDTTQAVLLESNIPLGGNGFTINWYFGGALIHTGLNYLATQIGTYTVETIKNTPDIPPLCNYATTTVEVTQSSVATAMVSVSTDFDNVGVLIVTITGGYGVYEYQLDNGPFQTSNEFYNVHNGDHVVSVRDVSSASCGAITIDATVIMYPKYFTPNGDGINETWNIFDLQDQPQAEIFIFDRFGKFIKQIFPSGNGWNGLYNGRPLPATDYWFKVLYKGRDGEDKEFRAHFSLKR